MSALTPVQIVKVYETKIWIENDILGDRHVVAQHETCEPFTYATFHYNYRYTDNAGTLEAARALAISLGAAEPVEMRHRGLAAALAQPVAAEAIHDKRCPTSYSTTNRCNCGA